jgi:hypothetical protein
MTGALWNRKNATISCRRTLNESTEKGILLSFELDDLVNDVLISDFVPAFIVVTEPWLVRIDETGRLLGRAGLSDIVSDAQCKQGGVHVTPIYEQREVARIPRWAHSAEQAPVQPDALHFSSFRGKDEILSRPCAVTMERSPGWYSPQSN